METLLLLLAAVYVTAADGGGLEDLLRIVFSEKLPTAHLGCSVFFFSVGCCKCVSVCLCVFVIRTANDIAKPVFSYTFGWWVGSSVVVATVCLDWL